MTFEMAQIHLDELRDYCDHAERWARREQRDFRERAEKQLNRVDQDSEGSRILVESLAEDLDQLETTFPNILRTSLLMQGCSTFEHSLVRIARCFERAGTTSFLDFPNDAGIKKGQSYLKKVGQVDFPDQNEMWLDILKVFEVRNVVVHANGTLLEKPKHPKQVKHKQHYEALQSRWPGDLRLDRFRQIAFSAAFIPRMLDLFEKFLRELRARTRDALRKSED
jgi:hypothetical protein